MKMENKKKIELVVWYGNDTKQGFIEIDGVKIKESNRVVFGPVLDILEHLEYEVKFKQCHQKEEITPKSPVEFYIHNIFNIIGDDVINKLSIQQMNEIHKLSKEAKEMEKL